VSNREPWGKDSDQSVKLKQKIDEMVKDVNRE
jgi:hypothetical protein